MTHEEWWRRWPGMAYGRLTPLQREKEATRTGWDAAIAERDKLLGAVRELSELCVSRWEGCDDTTMEAAAWASAAGRLDAILKEHGP